MHQALADIRNRSVHSQAVGFDGTYGIVKEYVRDNFMVGIKYNSPADRNGQTLPWRNKVHGKVHAIISEIPFQLFQKIHLDFSALYLLYFNCNV